MKRISFILLSLVLIFTLTSCDTKEEVRTLRIYNWQDYIDDGTMEDGATSMLDDFAEYYYETYGEKIEVVYDTFETNESMFNTLKTGKTTYDLVCPSEYMIMRMIKADMLIPFEEGSTPTYDKYASKYIQDLFKNTPVSNGGSMADYAKGYMWGTVGLVYDPEYVTEEEMASWRIMWNPKYKGMVSSKDSIRDTYVPGVMHVYLDELEALRADYLNGVITSTDYTTKINEIMNRCDDETLDKVLDHLQDLKANLFGFEVDSGKTDIVNGKIRIQLAWSGDAVYSMSLAEEEDDKILAFSVPQEGSNIWFDGWVMPKGADTFLAQTFVDYVSRPENAVRNMNMVGYTSAIAGQEVFDEISDWYDESVELDDGSFDTTDLIPYDLNYFFEGTLDEDCDGIIYTSSLRGQLYTQYPDLGTVERCAIMQDFGIQNNKVIEMWASVKAVNLPIWVTIGFFLIVAGIFALVIVYTVFNKRKFRKNKR